MKSKTKNKEILILGILAIIIVILAITLSILYVIKGSNEKNITLNSRENNILNSNKDKDSADGINKDNKEKEKKPVEMVEFTG